MSRFSDFRAALVAALSAASAVSWAASLEMHVPSTAVADGSSDVIDRAVRALGAREGESQINRAARGLVAAEGESHISRVWVFTTAEANTVFVHYRKAPDADAHEKGPTI